MDKVLECLRASSLALVFFLPPAFTFAQGKGVMIHSYGEQGKSFRLNDKPHANAIPAMEGRVNALFNSLDHRIKVKGSQPAPLSLLSNSIRTNEYKFSVDGFPLCQFQVKAHESIHGSVTILGNMPDVSIEKNFSMRDWPLADDAFGLVQDTRYDHDIIEPLKLRSKKACLWIDDNSQLVPVWQLTVSADHLEYIAVADLNDVYSFEKGFFHVDGTARIYPNNPLDEATEDFTVTNLQPNSDGEVLVENDKFITLLDTDIYDYYRAVEVSSDTHPYLFAPETSDDSFAEVSLFTNANRALDWFVSHGYTNFGDEAIRIVVHAELSGGDTNNALYQPGSSFPTIFVGNGDGLILQNLALDYDVVAHEFGHHVVYHSIKQIKQESLVLHEGLADFFTFAKTGNACLGESICPESSTICAIQNQCLRTAENDLAYDDPDLPAQAHLQGQFISGMLWDLIHEDGIDSATVVEMVIKAIDLFVTDSGYQHLILALLMVDEANYEGKNCQTIYNRALERGLEEVISEFDCSLISTLVESSGGLSSVTGEDQVTETTETTSATKSSSNNWCGAIGVSAHASSSVLFLLALPLLIGFRRWF